MNIVEKGTLADGMMNYVCEVNVFVRLSTFSPPGVSPQDLREILHPQCMFVAVREAHPECAIAGCLVYEVYHAR
jgi:hypothetical protein